MFTLTFSTDNAAFAEDPALEVAAILADVGDAVTLGDTSGPCRDTNGNQVGSWSLTEAE